MKYSIEYMQAFAKDRGGKCLSKVYVNPRTKLTWQCACENIWEARFDSVRRGAWCPVCGRRKTIEAKRLSIEEMHKIAEEYGGKCLTAKYINSQTKLLWKCAKGHRWEAVAASIKQGIWCPFCGREKKADAQKLGIEKMREIAKQRGGKCLSDQYIDGKTKLIWQCSEKHEWKGKPYDIRSGTWCPICSTGIGERICREYFEQLFGKKFPKSYPAWLINSAGNRMEFDGYCQSLGLAFEHHGEQHYTTKTPFVKTKEKLQKRKEDDKLKRRLCEKRGVFLIEIPSIFSRLSPTKIREHIKTECENRGIPIPNNFDSKTVDLKNAYITSKSTEELSILQSIAKRHRGKLLSTHYVTAQTKLLWQCAKGHQWKATPNKIKSGKWCPFCAGHIRLTIEELQKIAEKNGGKCLSKKYVNARQKVLWQCAKGHRWKAIPDSVKRGSWCPFCHMEKISPNIHEMRELATSKGGKCLSDKYINWKTKLLWQCAKGHQWEAIPRSIKQGSWCPDCAGYKKLSIEEMHNIANQRGGMCLSKIYVNTKAKLLWQCTKGHQWEARPDAIKRGTWCPICARERRKRI